MGDPLDPTTEVGYIHPRTLDHLAEIAQRSRARARLAGGRRLSPHQAEPLLVTSQDDLPDLFAQEIPAYVLAVRECASAAAAAALANHFSPGQPRLAVSLLGMTGSDAGQAERVEALAAQLNAHAILVDRPTSQVAPFFHEGNDYAASLTLGRLLVQ